jgi:hypothetical protein
MSADYKYKLQPYAPGQKRTCPECGHTKVYVRYIDTETNDFLPYEYGRCERVNSCGYHKQPDGEIIAATRPKPSTPVQQQFVSADIVSATFRHYNQNPFVQWLTEKFGSKKAEDAIRKYHIGTAKNNGTLFWYRNIAGQYCNAKRIYYKPDGKRDRDTQPSYTHLTGKGYRICLFGEHLLKGHNPGPIGIVESEKTAIVCSIYQPELTWLACGGANNLTHEKMSVLTKKQVLLFPDADNHGRASFGTAAAKLRQMRCFVEIVDIVPEAEDGTDMADILLLTPVTGDNILITPGGYPAGWD